MSTVSVRFVKKMSVNAYPLPTCSHHTPCLHRKIFFCTFADVEECPDLLTPTPEGRGQKLNLQSLVLWQNQRQVVHAPISEAA